MFTSIACLVISMLRVATSDRKGGLEISLFWTYPYVLTSLGILYPLFCFFITQMSSISVNATMAELRGTKPQGFADYFSLTPYFNAWDFGSDYNFRACFNAYSAERPRWNEPTHLGKLLNALSAKAAPASAQPHQHGANCNHEHEKSSKEGHRAVETPQRNNTSVSRPSYNAAAEQLV